MGPIGEMFLPFFLIGLLGICVGVYILYLVIKALRIYIKKNS